MLSTSESCLSDINEVDDQSVFMALFRGGMVGSFFGDVHCASMIKAELKAEIGKRDQRGENIRARKEKILFSLELRSTLLDFEEYFQHETQEYFR